MDPIERVEVARIRLPIDVGVLCDLVTALDDSWRRTRVCETCPVREECLTAGMNEPDGIWGGLLPREREARRKAAA